MMKKFILALATISLLGTLPSCTSKDSKNEDVIADDGAADDMAESAGETSLDENLDESLDAGTTEPQMADTTANPDAAVADTTTDDQLTIDSFGEGTTDQGADPNASAEPVPDANSMANEPAPPTTMEPSSNDLAMEPPTTTTDAQEIAPPAEMVNNDQPASSETNLDEEPKPAPKSLQKMAATPWKVGKKWVNGIYFARPGDSLESISQTIYGDDRTKELKKINPTYNNRDVKPGDKVYYASVVRPDDSGQVLTYFEEKNIPAKSYVSKPGDNIRKVSQELLGYPEAWKEVWAYNTVESKQEIGEGVELRYWDAQAHLGSPSTQPMADQAPAAPPAPPMDNMTPPPMEDPMAANNTMPPPNDLPPPPDTSMAGGDLPPPPPPMDPPPPPPSMDMAPPPPPPPPVAGNDAGMGDALAAEGDSTLAMGAVAVMVLGAVALIIVRRKRKQREMDQALGETHVG